MRGIAAVTGITALGLGLAVALLLRFRPDAESGAPPRAAPVPGVKAEASAVDLRNGDADAPRPESPLAAERNAVARPAATEERVPLPGEAPATPLAKRVTDLQGNVIVRRPGPPASPSEMMIEGERAFSVEPIDAAWAPGAEADLLAKFAQIQGLKLVDLRVECRSTMCRAEFTQPLPAPGERPFDRFESLGLTMFTVFDPSGAGLKSFAYLWRDGFAPPWARQTPN